MDSAGHFDGSESRIETVANFDLRHRLDHHIGHSFATKVFQRVFDQSPTICPQDASSTAKFGILPRPDV